jgi:hypothetical protein
VLRKDRRKAAVGQAPWLAGLQLLTNPLQPHPCIRVLSSPLPPLPHVCDSGKSAGVCLCQAAVLVVLDWLLAFPPDAALLQRRAHSAARGHGE